MSIKDINRRHLTLVSIYSARNAIRGGTGLVFFILVLFFGLMVANLIVSPVEQFKANNTLGSELTEEQVMDEMIRVARPVVEWALGGGDLDGFGAEARTARKDARNWSTFLLDDNPAILSALLMVMIFSLPFLVALGAFNQFSGDVQSRGIRFVLLRTERANIFFGRFLGTAIFTIIVLTLLMLIITLYVGLKLHIYNWPDLITWSLRGCLALAILALPYVALCSWFSSLIDSPFGSLAVCKLGVGLVPLFALIGKNQWEPAKYINYALPWGVQNLLLHPAWGFFLLAVGACMGYTLVFLYLGYNNFSRRDL